MPSFNKVILIGNITRDLELRYTPKGQPMLVAGLAINRHYTTESGEKREEVTFVDVTLWGRQAEVVHQYCRKGAPLMVEGRLQLDTWDDRETGQKRSRLRVVAEGFQLLGGKRDGDGDGGGRRDNDGDYYPAASTPPPSRHYPKPNAPAASSEAGQEPVPEPGPDDDIPF